MSHAIRLASLVAACVISLATAAAADPADLDYRLQSRLNPLLEARLDQLLEAKLEAQAANLLARESVATADSADLTTRMTCAASDSGRLGCVAHPVCAHPEIELASAPPPTSLARC